MEEVKTAHEALVNQLQAPAAGSKKFRMVVIGLILTFSVFIISAAIFKFAPPEVASHVAPTAQIVIGAFTTMVLGFLGAETVQNKATINSLASREP